MKAGLLIALAVVSTADIASWAPTAPSWPNAWSGYFTEISYYSGEVRETDGYAFFDYPNGHLNWTRFDAVGDPVCATAFYMPPDTTCSHLIANGTEYLYTPETDQCCTCCTSAQNCNVFPPTVLQYYTYVSQETYNGQEVYEWTYTSGGQQFYYLESTESTPTDRQWVAMFSPYFNYTNFWDFSSTVNSNSFQLPQSCPGSDMCTGVCVFVRSGGPPMKSAPPRNPFL